MERIIIQFLEELKDTKHLKINLIMHNLLLRVDNTQLLNVISKVLYSKCLQFYTNIIKHKIIQITKNKMQLKFL